MTVLHKALASVGMLVLSTAAALGVRKLAMASKRRKAARPAPEAESGIDASSLDFALEDVVASARADAQSSDSSESSDNSANAASSENAANAANAASLENAANAANAANAESFSQAD